MNEITAYQELLELAEAYREADEKEKQFKATKEQLRGPILDLMTEVVMDQVPLSKKTVKVSSNNIVDVYDGDIELWRARNYPTWNIVGVSGDDQTYIIDIEEDPYFLKYEFEVNGFRFGRTISIPSPTFPGIPIPGPIEAPGFPAAPNGSVRVSRDSYPGPH